jgi:serine/threonine protein phosphatase PrpC
LAADPDDLVRLRDPEEWDQLAATAPPVQVVLDTQTGLRVEALRAINSPLARSLVAVVDTREIDERIIAAYKNKPAKTDRDTAEFRGNSAVANVKLRRELDRCFIQSQTDHTQRRRRSLDQDSSATPEEDRAAIIPTEGDLNAWREQQGDRHTQMTTGHAASASIQGRRDYQEDRCIIAQFEPNVPSIQSVQVYAVMDGHGGTDSAELVERELVPTLQAQIEEDLGRRSTEFLESTFRNTLKLLPVRLSQHCQESNCQAGTTLSMVLHVKLKNGLEKLYCVNTGDSRSIAIPLTNVDTYPPFIPLSMDAKPDHPRFRPGIENRGGSVWWHGGWRVNGRLAVARGIGNYNPIPVDPTVIVAGPGVNPRPKITSFYISPDDHLLVVIGSDGLYDRMAESAFVPMAREMLANRRPHAEIAQALVREASNRDSGDNITAVVAEIGRVRA